MQNLEYALLNHKILEISKFNKTQSQYPLIIKFQTLNFPYKLFLWNIYKPIYSSAD